MKFLLLLGCEVCSDWKFDFCLAVTCGDSVFYSEYLAVCNNSFHWCMYHHLHF